MIVNDNILTFLAIQLFIIFQITRAELLQTSQSSSVTKPVCNVDSCLLDAGNIFEPQTSLSKTDPLNYTTRSAPKSTQISTSTSTSISTVLSTLTSIISATPTELISSLSESSVVSNSEDLFAEISKSDSGIIVDDLNNAHFEVTSDVNTTNSTNTTEPFIPVQNYTNKNIQLNQSNETIEECHFLSFEEWKRQKAVDNKQINDSQPQAETIANELVPTTSGIDSSTQIPVTLDEDQGKIYKDRFNYASVGCAATIVKTNSHAKGASAILVENKDSYLLNQCSSSQKFVVIELCQDILVDTVVIGNFEFFSSNFRKIRISVSDRFPVGSSGMKVLGEFEAENIRDVQSFNIENPLIWARYLKLEILSHYGDEFYCPISLIRVYGKTMMEEFKMAEGHESFIGGEPEIKNEELVINNSMKDISNFTGINIQNEECRVALPHLGLTEFLKDINSTASDYCDAMYPLINEPETTQTIETKTTQESIYKNIMKRLSLLESNASLSLLYIEEQSKLLSQAFTNLEKRQSSNFESLINSFNDTMHNQISYFKNAYFSIQVEASKLFKAQENNHQNLLEESHHRMTILGNQLKFQKRLSILNTMIIICILSYVVLTRDVYIEDHMYDHFQQPLRTSQNTSGYSNLLNKYKRKNSKRNNKSKRRKQKSTNLIK